jgi:hypothetical protein
LQQGSLTEALIFVRDDLTIAERLAKIELNPAAVRLRCSVVH